jgi:dTDP-4-dehydrorhamnose 3,5-epimerase
MVFSETAIAGAYIVDLEPGSDARGFFARVWSEEELAARGLITSISQMNISFSIRRGTVRGLHYQTAPHQEVKFVRCTRGAVFDVLVDLRPDSPSYLRWAGYELTQDNRRAMYVPKGCAHGYLTLCDDAEVTYSASAPYTPLAERGIRYDDDAIGIRWPLEVSVVSDKDRAWPDVSPEPRTSERPRT